MSKSDKIVEDLKKEFDIRSCVGIDKYKTTLQDNNKDDFLQHLKEELMKTHVYREDKIVQIECKNIINFMQSDEATLDHRFEQFAHVDNQEDLISYILDRDAKDIIICGLHYGKCITTAAMILEDAINIGIEEAEPVLAGRNLYIKRDMCCLWPDDEISQHDRVYKQMQLELI